MGEGGGGGGGKGLRGSTKIRKKRRDARFL